MSGHVQHVAPPSFVDFDRELHYWRSHYRQSAFYREGLAYEDFEPAVMLGINVFLHDHGRPFEDQCDQLDSVYRRTRGTSRLDWDDGKPAAVAAWQRCMTGG